VQRGADEGFCLAVGGWGRAGLITAAGADVCDADPGFTVAVTVTAGLRRMIEVWRGDLSWCDTLRTGALEVQGPEAMRRAVPRWFTLPAYAAAPRPP
jgi:hypothetical protein